MNPNLRIFFKRSIYVAVFAIFVAAMVYSVPNVLDLDASTIGGYIMYGLGGFMMIVIGVLFLGLIIRVVWTSIMNRTDTIVMCCPDKNQEGVHLVCSHYNPGGESTEGFSSYFHYYIDDKGKLHLSKKVDNDGRELTRSLAHLSEQTRLQLDPDLTQSKHIGSYSSGDNTCTDEIIQLSTGELHFLGYEGLIDYGFKITYKAAGQLKWKVTI